MIDADTEAALRQRLSALGGNIAWPNENASFDLPYVEVSVFRNEPQRLTLKGGHRRYGILQITACAKEGAGTRQAVTQAETIAALFPVDLRLGSVRITKAATISGGFPDRAHWRVPVSIPFETITTT